MADLSGTTVDVSRLGRHLTIDVKVTGLRIWRVRWWIAYQLITLAARVIGCNIVVDLRSDHG